MGKFNFDDLIDDDNSVVFNDAAEQKKEEPVVAEKLQQIEKVVEEIIELHEEPAPQKDMTEPEKIIDEIKDMVEEAIVVNEPQTELSAGDLEELKPSATYISNISNVVKIAENDLETEKEEAEREKVEKPLREKEALRRELLAKKETGGGDTFGSDGSGNGGNNGGGGENNGDNGDGGEDGLIEKSVAAIMHESMIPYSEFVILDRALPRVEDGLKPVQRRILYAMNDMGLTPDKPFRKSAGIVGECLGKYHPHGDTSVYDAMVRMAQPFNMNMPLILGQGNFGSDDGDGAAAMRYTEAKLAPLALELLRDIDKKTVPFSLTYDDRNTEPDILPARFPNLLTNGTSGIAVGLATNIPPHNLAEVIDAHIAFIDNTHYIKTGFENYQGTRLPNRRLDYDGRRYGARL
jgi:hypothetical protein